MIHPDIAALASILAVLPVSSRFFSLNCFARLIKPNNLSISSNNQSILLPQKFQLNLLLLLAASIPFLDHHYFLTRNLQLLYWSPSLTPFVIPLSRKNLFPTPQILNSKFPNII